MLKVTNDTICSRKVDELPRIPAAIEAEIKRSRCSIAAATKRVVDRLNRTGRVR